ncbi:protein TIFY 10B-like isoform X2 [Pistacia vera]|uniref:protein TIFY 10B-like isoform X2 n=1 Tax=Pistacia vera TaxID=55513 RepID=UPI001262BE2E|nr:protein TIFY 10B-like isoform X2 [Pistacia vera]
MISMASSGQKSSNFTQTCNLLSQYLKEKGNFGDFSRGIASKPEGVEFETSRPQSATTMNLLPNLENVGASSSSSVKAADFFNNKAEATVESGAGSQMTIFYAGKVHVFNGFSAEKAKEIMALATKSGSSVNTTSSRAFTPDLNIATSASETNNIASQDRLFQHLKPPQAPITSDFPIKRRASLHRFFEKRKDRVVARAPYQINGASVAPAKPEESREKPWLLELEAQSSKQLDLNL